jgi:LPS-assembly lipoprotein
VTSGTSFANAAYDYSQQGYANVRAKRDAENRVATAVAGDIRNKLAVWFASRR